MNFFLQRSRKTAIALIENYANVSGTSEGIFHFVLGNEACDLDSAMSAILFAWFMTKMHGPSTHYIPVLNTNRSHYRLKTETSYLLGKFQIGQSDLVFRDDLRLDEILKKIEKPFKVTLVDYHVLSKQEELLRPLIAEVIDHRPQAALYGSSTPVQIEIVGSCVTLISERIHRAIEQNAMTIAEEERDQLKYMVSGPVILDTLNLKKAAGKVTARDEKVIELFWGSDYNELTRFYNELCEAKYSAKGLSAEDLMLKDSKFIQSDGTGARVMFSTLHDTWVNFKQRKDASAAVPAILNEEQCSLWVALAPQQQDSSEKSFKPVILYSSSKGFVEQVQTALSSATDPCLEIDSSEATSVGEHYLYLRMYNVKASRKQVLPIVQRLIDAESPATCFKDGH